MMIPIKTQEGIERMREACRVAATVLQKIRAYVEPGVNTYDLDQEAKRLIEGLGAKSACHNYKVGRQTFPSYTCLSVNEEVVHGIGSLRRILQEGDVIALDVVVAYEGYIGDNAATVGVGKLTPEVSHLLQVTEEALYEGISRAREGSRVGDVSNAVQRYVESRGLSVVREFVGHGVGESMHEEPQIPNFVRRGTGPKLRAGMTLAIEPMVNLGGPEVEVLGDGWTVVTVDRLPSAHFEHTVLITSGEPEILTSIKK
jgi:methionyl aminopeptidase